VPIPGVSKFCNGSRRVLRAVAGGIRCPTAVRRAAGEDGIVEDRDRSRLTAAGDPGIAPALVLAAEPYSVGEEVAHAVTHGAGLALSIAGLVLLVARAALRGDAWHVTGAAIFGAGLVALYAASTLYHGLSHGRAKRVFQRLDHTAIFLLIAATYTPFTLVSLHGPWGWTLLGAVWGLALLGIALESIGQTRRLSVLLHLVMGWLVVVAAGPLTRALPPEGLGLLVAGGLAYTVGVVFYAWRGLPYNHAIWHVCVLIGSACHFGCVLRYVIPAAT